MKHSLHHSNIYFHLSNLAYTGNLVVFDFGKYLFMGGMVAMYPWPIPGAAFIGTKK